MRKLLVAIALSAIGVLGAFVVPASVAGALPPGRNHQVTVPFSGSSTFDFSTPCPFAHQVYDATVGARHDIASLHLDGCVRLGTPFPFSGSFAIMAPGRGQLTGTAAGSIGDTASASCAAGLLGSSLDFVLTPTSGTKRFRHTTATIHLVGTWCSPATPNVPGPISGTLTGSLAIKHDRTE